MELQTESRIYRRQILLGGSMRLALLLRARHLVRATKESAAAKNEILRNLPGVFSMKLKAGDKEIRLIKEADELRIMKKSEKSECLLTIIFSDYAELADVQCKETTMHKGLAEGRILFQGPAKYCNVIMRVNHEGDKCTMPDELYTELYGRNE